MKKLYPFAFSKTIYERFCKKLQRAADICRWITDVSERDVINLIRSNSSIPWRKFKTRVVSIQMVLAYCEVYCETAKEQTMIWGKEWKADGPEPRIELTTTQMNSIMELFPRKDKNKAHN